MRFVGAADFKWTFCESKNAFCSGLYAVISK